MTEPLALKPDLILFHARANAQFILGTHLGRYVIAKAAIPGIQETEEERVEMIFEGGSYDEAIAVLRGILQPSPLTLVQEAA